MIDPKGDLRHTDSADYDRLMRGLKRRLQRRLTERLTVREADGEADEAEGTRATRRMGPGALVRHTWRGAGRGRAGVGTGK